MSILHNLRRYTPAPLVRLHDWAYYQYIKACPRGQAERIYREYLGREIDWENPTEFNEKGRWIQFRTDTSLWPVLADKLRAREWIAARGFAEYLPKLYGHWEKAADIDFDALPRQFVVKTNHGSGGVIIVQDKAKADRAAIRRAMDKALREPYGVMTAEPHYLSIPPRVMAEELLPATSPQSSSIIDYKTYCSWGKTLIWYTCYDRTMKDYACCETCYDNEWKRLDWFEEGLATKDIDCPKSFAAMRRIAENISRDMPLIRIDFYDVNGHPYIGELTMTSCAFTGNDLTPEAQMALGAMIDLSRVTRKS